MFGFSFKQKTAYELRISDWSSDVCASDLQAAMLVRQFGVGAVLIDVGRGLVAGGQQRDGGERRNDGERRTFHRGPPVRRLEKLAKPIHVATQASTVTI